MSKIGYLDCANLNGTVDAEDEELLQIFANQRESAKMIMFRDGMTLWLEPKQVVAVKAKAAKAKARREAMEAARVQKLRENAARIGARVIIGGLLAACAGCIVTRIGDPNALIGAMGALLLANCAAEAAGRRKAVRECRQC